MKKEISVADYASHILKALEKGVLITTKSGEKINTMTVSWGSLGIEWGKPIFTTFVRESRFTREQLDKTMEFTVNIPMEACDKATLAYCGTHSGRAVDKLRERNLTAVPSDCIEAPGIREFPLTLECRVVCRQPQDLAALSPEKMAYYPPVGDGDSQAETRDFHIAYCGEILKAYILEP